ncbi:hypothetical protein FALBO_11487, partial [Fusarium albosuccineum]
CPSLVVRTIHVEPGSRIPVAAPEARSSTVSPVPVPNPIVTLSALLVSSDPDSVAVFFVVTIFTTTNYSTRQTQLFNQRQLPTGQNPGRISRRGSSYLAIGTFQSQSRSQIITAPLFTPQPNVNVASPSRVAWNLAATAPDYLNSHPPP